MADILDKANLTLLIINKDDMLFYRTKNYKICVKGYGVLTFATNLSNKHRKQLLNTGINASKRVVHKTGEFLGNEIVDEVNNLYDRRTVKTKPAEEIIIPPEKILSRAIQSYQKKIKAELCQFRLVSIYATKKELDRTTGVGVSDLAAKKDFVALKLDFTKLTNVPTSLNNIKTNVDDLDVGKLKTVPEELKN